MPKDAVTQGAGKQNAILQKRAKGNTQHNTENK